MCKGMGVVTVSSSLDKTFTPLVQTLPCTWLPSLLRSEDQTICHSMVLTLLLLILFLSTYKIWLAFIVLLNSEFNSYQCVRHLRLFRSMQSLESKQVNGCLNEINT